MLPNCNSHVYIHFRLYRYYDFAENIVVLDHSYTNERFIHLYIFSELVIEMYRN